MPNDVLLSSAGAPDRLPSQPIENPSQQMVSFINLFPLLINFKFCEVFLCSDLSRVVRWEIFIIIHFICLVKFSDLICLVKYSYS